MMEQELTDVSDKARILLLNAWILLEPLVAKFQAIGW